MVDQRAVSTPHFGTFKPTACCPWVPWINNGALSTDAKRSLEGHPEHVELAYRGSAG